MKQKYIKYLVVSLLIVLFIIVGRTKTVHAEEGAGFSVTPVLGENQIESGLGYFNLLLEPNQKQTLKFNISNNNDSEIKVSTSFGTAFTGNAGNVLYTPSEAKMDTSLKINIKDYVKVPEEVTVPAHGKAIVSAEVMMPKTSFKGVIAGGFNFNEQESSSATKASKTSKSAASITNHYTYVIGLIMQNSKESVSPNLTLDKVEPSQVNGRNVISANLTNSAMTYLLDMNANAEVTHLGDKSIKYSFDSATLKMAPNSNFDLGIPVSIQGALKKGETSAPLKSGRYQLEMVVYGNKSTNGKYQTMVDGQVTKYDYKWTFSKVFTITETEAKRLNAKDVTIEHTQESNWFVYGLFLIILSMAIFIFVLLIKRSSKGKEEEEESL